MSASSDLISGSQTSQIYSHNFPFSHKFAFLSSFAKDRTTHSTMTKKANKKNGGNTKKTPDSSKQGDAVKDDNLEILEKGRVEEEEKTTMEATLRKDNQRLRNKCNQLSKRVKATREQDAHLKQQLRLWSCSLEQLMAIFDDFETTETIPDWRYSGAIVCTLAVIGSYTEFLAEVNGSDDSTDEHHMFQNKTVLANKMEAFYGRIMSKMGVEVECPAFFDGIRRNQCGPL